MINKKLVFIEVIINFIIPINLIILFYYLDRHMSFRLPLIIIPFILTLLNYIKYKKNFSKSTIFIFVFITILILEFIFIIYHYYPKPNTVVTYDPKNHIINKKNNLYFKQGLVNHKFTSDGKIIFDVKYFINNKNFRDDNYIFNKINSSKEKINFYGDSITFGHGLHNSSTLTKLFNSKSKKYYANNISFLGWGPIEVYNLIENNKTNKFLFITHNDHINRRECGNNRSGFGAKKNLVLKNNFTIEFQGICADVWNRTGVFNRIDKIIDYLLENSKLSYQMQIIYNLFEDKIFSRELEKYIGVILEIKKIAKQNNQEFILGTIYDDRYFKRYKYSKQDVIKIFLENNIQILDLSLGFDSKNYRKNYVIDNEVEHHPNQKANELRAKIINDYLILEK
jgi:hypothetical protein